MLAAGLGRRLFGDENKNLPKGLLRFNGESLIARHIKFLQYFGVESLTLVVGHRRNDLVNEALAIAKDGFIDWVHNPRYREGPILSLVMGAEVLQSGNDVLFMDADVLYHPDLLRNLLGSPHSNSLLIDRIIRSDDDPVKICLRNDRIVDFGKIIDVEYDEECEWPGFMKMDGRIAYLVLEAAKSIIAKGEIEGAYERAFSGVLRSEPEGTFNYVDITDIPWIEIDYPSDLEKAKGQIFPSISNVANG